MQEVTFEEAVEQILGKDPRYHREAYLFVRDALEYTKKSIARTTREPILHVTGQQLLSGIREFALGLFGPMAMTVFEEWGVAKCEDFGEIVFNLVEMRVLAKTDTDSRADFTGGYKFWDAFRQPFVPGQRGTPIENSSSQENPSSQSGEVKSAK